MNDTTDFLTAESIYLDSQERHALHMIDRIPTHITIPPFSAWAAEHRYYPPGISVYPGRHDPDTAPHMNEILDRLHPDDPVTHITIMKSVQSTATTMSENAIGAGIQYKLWNMLYLTATQPLALVRFSANIDPMIDNSGIAHLLKPISNRSGKKNKDNSLYKEFSGGIKLVGNSYNSITAMKSNTFGFIICDEWDEAPPEMRGMKAQGDIQGLIEGRTMGLPHFKILFISTPTIMETSRIYRCFLEGDQRYYFVPCPECGEKQVLVMMEHGEKYGLTFSCQTERETGKRLLIPESVRYVCKYCGKEFHETKKQKMLKLGEWRPTATPVDRKKTSYHISGLMSPEMFLKWDRVCQQYVNTDFGEDILKYKDYVINYKGWPWASTKKTMAWEDFRDRADDYALGEVPEGKLEKTDSGELYRGAIYLEAGCDVHGDRLEMQVVGFGPGMESWTIDYQVFFGDPSEIENKCWKNLKEWVGTHAYRVCGKGRMISLCAIDAGYQKERRDKDFPGKTLAVYNFVARNPDRFIAVMGIPEARPGEEVIRSAKINELGSLLTVRYNVNVSALKELIMSNIDLHAGPRAIHFPRHTRTPAGKREYLPDEFYRQFLSERYQEEKPGDFAWVKIYKRNEVWDTYIYALAAAYHEKITMRTETLWVQAYRNLIES